MCLHGYVGAYPRSKGSEPVLLPNDALTVHVTTTMAPPLDSIPDHVELQVHSSLPGLAWQHRACAKHRWRHQDQRSQGLRLHFSPQLNGWSVISHQERHSTHTMHVPPWPPLYRAVEYTGDVCVSLQYGASRTSLTPTLQNGGDGAGDPISMAAATELAEVIETACQTLFEEDIPGRDSDVAEAELRAKVMPPATIYDTLLPYSVAR